MEDSIAKLLDDDIAAVLSCINAIKYLKKLKLAGCVSITGRGLEPLRGTVVLEWIDMILIPWRVRYKPKMCETIVLPILDSIIATHGNSLKNIRLPKLFHTYGTEEQYLIGTNRWDPDSVEERTKQSSVNNFLERHAQNLRGHKLQCTKCCRIHDLCNNNYYSDDPMEEVRIRSCYECLNFYCSDYDDDCDGRVIFCHDCEKRTCTACVPLAECFYCVDAGTVTCQKCRKQMQCEICMRNVCDRCHAECNYCNRKGCWECLDWMECENEDCKNAHCGNCYEEGTDRDVKACESHEAYWFSSRQCSSCRFSSCSRKWSEAPECCLSMIGISRSAAAKLQEEKDKSNEDKKKSNDEANKLTVDNCRLKEEVNRVTEENNALSARIRRANVFCNAITSALGGT